MQTPTAAAHALRAAIPVRLRDAQRLKQAGHEIIPDVLPGHPLHHGADQIGAVAVVVEMGSGLMVAIVGKNGSCPVRPFAFPVVFRRRNQMIDLV